MAATSAARRHTDQGRERKQQLLDHATRLFATRGYANTRVIDICKEAGVAKGLFYWYFDNKEALFAELVRSRRSELEAARAEAIDPAADPLTRLRQAAESSVRFIARHAEFFTVLRMERREPTVSALLREAADTDVAGVARLVAEGQRAGLVTADAAPAFLAQGVAGSVTTFCHAYCTGRLDVSVDELAGLVGAWVLRAVGGHIAGAQAEDLDDQDDQAVTLRRLPTGARQLERVPHTTQPMAPTGISAR